MESFENRNEHSSLDPQELSLLQNCSIMPLNPKNLDTNFPAGWEGMGRSGHCPKIRVHDFLILQV